MLEHYAVELRECHLSLLRRQHKTPTVFDRFAYSGQYLIGRIENGRYRRGGSGPLPLMSASPPSRLLAPLLPLRGAAVVVLVALTCIFVVELPGIELDTEIALNCGNATFDDAKQRQTT
jgi:hypothetical protein